MRNFFLSRLTAKPQAERSLASQLGYCFVVILVILIVTSITITSAYTSVLKQDRSDALQTTAVTSALAISHASLQEGMKYPLSVSTYFINGKEKNYILNIYTKAGNSFLRVFTSTPPDDSAAAEQVTLDGAGEAYRKAFDQQEAVVVERSDKTGSFVAGVAPVIGTEGTVSGLVEILMPSSDFTATSNGLSLSWIFTMLSIAVALTIVYFEIHKLFTAIFGHPDRQLPKIIRYGLSGCQSISFFSAMACSMPPLVISSYLLSASKAGKLPSSIPPTIFILIGGLFFAIGFFGFSTIRILFVRRFTTRISLIISVFAAFAVLLLSTILSNAYLYILLLMPEGFFLGMVFYFQREYRIYASRLGYEEFSERVIHNTQYSGYLLGACVGAVLAGIIYERFGLLAVSIICGSILIIVGIQALLFVQHCPASSSPPLHLPNFLYALNNKRSGTFVWSYVSAAGVQVAFYFAFLPSFLNILGLSLATIAFYFILFSFVGSVLIKTVRKLLPYQISMQNNIMLSAILQVSGFLILALMPTAKVLVVSVLLMGAASGLNDFRYLEYYKEMIREDKQSLARQILERGFGSGAVFGSIAFGSLFLINNLRLSLLIFTLLIAVVLFAYPLVTLLYAPAKTNTSGKRQRHKHTAEEEPEYHNPVWPEAATYQYPEAGNSPAGDKFPADYSGNEFPSYSEDQRYGQNTHNTYYPDDINGGKNQ